MLLFFLAQPITDFSPLYRQALEQRQQTLGPTARQTMESARDLALYLASRGDYAAAAPYLSAALGTSSTPAAATILHNWAVHLEATDAAVAEQLYRRALAIRARTLPAGDVELAVTRLNLAGLLLSRGSVEAKPLAASALGVFEKQLGPQDARVGAACGMLGALSAMAGDVAGSEAYFRRALAIAEKAHGPKAPETAAALENLADLLEQTNRQSTAAPLRTRAEQIRAGAR